MGHPLNCGEIVPLTVNVRTIGDTQVFAQEEIFSEASNRNKPAELCTSVLQLTCCVCKFSFRFGECSLQLFQLATGFFNCAWAWLLRPKRLKPLQFIARFSDVLQCHCSNLRFAHTILITRSIAVCRTDLFQVCNFIILLFASTPFLH